MVVVVGRWSLAQKKIIFLNPVFFCKHCCSRGETSGLNRKEIIESVKESLQNFNLGYIDLVLVHKTDPHCPIEGKIYT